MKNPSEIFAPSEFDSDIRPVTFHVSRYADTAVLWTGEPIDMKPETWSPYKLAYAMRMLQFDLLKGMVAQGVAPCHRPKVQLHLTMTQGTLPLEAGGVQLDDGRDYVQVMHWDAQRMWR